MEFIKKLLIVFLGSLCLLSGAFAIQQDSDLLAHWKLDDLTDSSGNGYDFELIGSTSLVNVDCHDNYCADFNGNGDELNFSDLNLSSGEDFTISYWVKLDSNTRDRFFLPRYDIDFIIEHDNNNENDGSLYVWDGTHHDLGINVGNGNWKHFSFNYDNSAGSFDLYIDGSYQLTQSVSIGVGLDENRIGHNTLGFFGRVDEVSIWKRALNGTDVTDLYNNGISYASAPTIQNDVQDFYNSSSISIQLNTSTNTNMSYYLDAGSEVSICNNCNNSVLNLSGLSEGSHSILFESTDSNGQVNSTANFTIDLTDPTINVFNTSTIETYSVTWSDVFNYSDDNLDSCWIIVESSTENCVSYTFSENGNQSVQVYVNDSAGNVATTTFYKFIDPKVYVYFEDPATNPIVNFSFGGINYSDYAAINIYDLGLGNHTLEFVKYGYARTNITLEFTSTSNINTTETIQVSLLYVNIRDRQTEALITDTINFDLVGDSYAGSYSTSTGLKTITDIKELPGTYRLTFSGTGFAANDYYFQHTGYSSVNITTYLINESETIPIKIVLRDIFSNPKSACIIKAKQYFISANDYLSVDMKTTNSLGEVIFDLEYAKWYQFVVECDGVTQTEPGQQITSTPLYLTWNEDEALTLFDGLPNLAYDPISWTNTSNTTGYFRFEYNDLNNIVSQGCLYVYEKAFSGNILLGSSCVSSASATININANYTAESGKTYIARGFVTYQGETTFVHEGSVTFMKGEGTWDYGLGNWGSMLLIGVLFLIGSAMHPFAAIAFSWIGAAASVKFEMLPVEWAALIGLGALALGLIIFRGKKQ